jgi:hypothetical protein
LAARWGNECGPVRSCRGAHGILVATSPCDALCVRRLKGVLLYLRWFVLVAACACGHDKHFDFEANQDLPEKIEKIFSSSSSPSFAHFHWLHEGF